MVLDAQTHLQCYILINYLKFPMTESVLQNLKCNIELCCQTCSSILFLVNTFDSSQLISALFLVKIVDINLPERGTLFPSSEGETKKERQNNMHACCSFHWIIYHIPVAKHKMKMPWLLKF